MIWAAVGAVVIMAGQLCNAWFFGLGYGRRDPGMAGVGIAAGCAVGVVAVLVPHLWPVWIAAFLTGAVFGWPVFRYTASIGGATEPKKERL